MLVSGRVPFWLASWQLEKCRTSATRTVSCRLWRTACCSLCNYRLVESHCNVVWNLWCPWWQHVTPVPPLGQELRHPNVVEPMPQLWHRFCGISGTRIRMAWGWSMPSTPPEKSPERRIWMSWSWKEIHHELLFWRNESQVVMEYCSVVASAWCFVNVLLFVKVVPWVVLLPKNIIVWGHYLPCDEALQQDEAACATYFRPAVLIPGVNAGR